MDTTQDKKRKRDDEITKLMGEYLLKGYKMLGNTCTQCGTILLRDRSQNDYCIGCEEVDKIHEAVSVVPNETKQKVAGTNDGHVTMVTEVVDEIPPQDKCTIKSQKLLGNQHENGVGFDQSIHNAMMKLRERIVWATSQLGTQNSLEIDIKLSELIWNCGRALKTLGELT